MAMVDPRRFPSLTRYLDLHGGRLDRYPECQSKTHLLRDLQAEGPLPLAPGSLPPEVEALLREPPPVNTWMSTMMLEAAFLAYADERFSSQAAAEDWVYRSDLLRFRGPLYRILMVLTRPSSMLRAAGTRWSAFHRGTSLEVETASERAVGTLRFPPWLYLPDAKINFSGSFRAALTAAGASTAVAELAEAGQDFHRYLATWS
jgi:hypothetical protein